MRLQAGEVVLTHLAGPGQQDGLVRHHLAVCLNLRQACTYTAIRLDDVMNRN